MEAYEVFAEIETQPGHTRVRELIQDHFMFVRADRDGALNARCLETFSLALQHGGHPVPELVVEYEERLLEFRHRDVHPKLRMRSLLCLARFLPKLKVSGAAQRDAYLARAINYCTEVLQLVSRKQNPRDWGEAQICLGRTYLERSTEEDIQATMTCATLALSVLSRESHPNLFAEAKSMMGSALVLRYTIAEHPSGQDADRAMQLFKEAGAILCEVGDSGGVQTIEACLERMRIAQRVAAQPAEVTIFCLEFAVSSLVPEDNPSLWAFARYTLGKAYLELLEKCGRTFKPAQSALRSFIMAMSVLEPQTVSWAKAYQGLAHSMAWRSLEDDMRKASWVLQLTNDICPIDPVADPFLHRILKHAPANPQELSSFGEIFALQPLRPLRHGCARATSM